MSTPKSIVTQHTRKRSIGIVCVTPIGATMRYKLHWTRASYARISEAKKKNKRTISKDQHSIPLCMDWFFAAALRRQFKRITKLCIDCEMFTPCGKSNLLNQFFSPWKPNPSKYATNCDSRHQHSAAQMYSVHPVNDNSLCIEFNAHMWNGRSNFGRGFLVWLLSWKWKYILFAAWSPMLSQPAQGCKCGEHIKQRILYSSICRYARAPSVCTVPGPFVRSCQMLQIQSMWWLEAGRRLAIKQVKTLCPQHCTTELQKTLLLPPKAFTFNHTESSLILQ